MSQALAGTKPGHIKAQNACRRASFSADSNNIVYQRGEASSWGTRYICDSTPWTVSVVVILPVRVVAQIGPTESDNSCGGSETLEGEEPMFARLEVGPFSRSHSAESTCCTKCRTTRRGWKALPIHMRPRPAGAFFPDKEDTRRMRVDREINPRRPSRQPGVLLVVQGVLPSNPLVPARAISFHAPLVALGDMESQVLYLGFNRITDISALCLERMPYLLAVDLQVFGLVCQKGSSTPAEHKQLQRGVLHPTYLSSMLCLPTMCSWGVVGNIFARTHVHTAHAWWSRRETTLGTLGDSTAAEPSWRSTLTATKSASWAPHPPSMVLGTSESFGWRTTGSEFCHRGWEPRRPRC